MAVGAKRVGTYLEELSEQSSRFILISLIGAFGWIGYIPVDRQLYPELGELFWIRLGLPLVAMVVTLWNYFGRHPLRSLYALQLLGCYLIFATGYLTGLTAGNPAYVGGLIFVWLLTAAFPVRRNFLWIMFALSLAAFLFTFYYTDIALPEESFFYSIRDLAFSLVFAYVISWMLDRIRRLSWRRARDNQQLQTLQNRFVAMAAHDLRNPISFVRTSLDLFAEERDDSEREQLMRRMSDRLDFSLALMDRLLEVVRLRSDKANLNLSEINPRQLFAELRRDYQLEADLRGRVLEFEVPIELPEKMVVDPVRLRQIIDNLVANAFNYTPNDSPIRIEVWPWEGELLVRVADRGPGIAPEDRKLIFDPFVRAGNSQNREKGSGLGLTIVRMLVESHGGTVSVEPNFGGGSVFTFSIPFRPRDRD